MPTRSKIIYTFTDEAPALATYSLLPIVEAFTASADIAVETRDISLAGRILASFPEQLGDKAVADHLAELGDLAVTPEANIIKLPNISASVPQLQAAIKELQAQGYALPDYPETVTTDAEKDARARYDKVKGSAVNPVLREGNSDRRAPLSVKNYARKHPHKMGAWAADSKSHVAHMSAGDFYGSEKAALIDAAGSVKIELIAKDGTATVLKEKTTVQAGEILDCAVMSKNALRNFIAAEIEDAKQKGVLLSVHLKATMMKVSDPIMFGQIVAEYYKDALAKHAEVLEQIGFNLNNGIGDLYARIKEGDVKELPLVIKSDVQGSAEALSDAVQKLSTAAVKLRVIHSGVGGITETDVLLASASRAIIIGFNIRPEPKASALAEREAVDIRLYTIIYDAIADIRAAMEGLLEPTLKERVLGRAEVRQVFTIPKAGTIAGSYVIDGTISRASEGVRVIRDHVVVYEGKLGSLRRFKDDVREVQQGYECGIGVENFSDVKPSDLLEVYTVDKVAAKL